MLVSSLSGSSESVIIDLLTCEHLEKLKQRQSGTQQNGLSAGQSQTKRYLILTYLVEFDRVHYPLPLSYQASTTDDMKNLKATIHRLNSELTALRQQKENSDPNLLSSLLAENQALKAKVWHCRNINTNKKNRTNSWNFNVIHKPRDYLERLRLKILNLGKNWRRKNLIINCLKKSTNS